MVKQYNERLVPIIGDLEEIKVEKIRFNNSWLSGFLDGDGHLRIYILKRSNRVEVRLLLQVDQKEEEILVQLQKEWGGYLGYREKQNTLGY